MIIIKESTKKILQQLKMNRKNHKRKCSDEYYWYDITNEELLKRTPKAEINPDYLSNYQTHFGVLPVNYVSVVDKILPIHNLKKIEKIFFSNGFDLVEGGHSSMKLVHYDRKIYISCDITIPNPNEDDEDDEDGNTAYPTGQNESIYISTLPTRENSEFLNGIFKKIGKYLIDVAKQADKFYMIAQNAKGLFTQRTKFKAIPIKDDRYDLFYGEKFPHEKMMKFISEPTEHLLLLHGDPGTGKSNYIKHMITNAQKKVIYIPPSMLSVISSPGFITFMMENKDSILLIEDAEEVLSVDRNSATNNLLGLTDGFLKDALNLKIIATFNCEIGKIDPALMRKGRMYLEYKFDKLSIDDCVKLSQFLNFSREINEPMTLAEFFNTEDNHFDNSLEKRRIGFL